MLVTVIDLILFCFVLLEQEYIC